MREFIQLLEQAVTVTLYRGDSSPIERFQIAKTDAGALLGIGIYLTDHPEIAKDYTVKGSDNVIFPVKRDDGGPYESPRALTTAYLQKIMHDAGFSQKEADLKLVWHAKYAEARSHINFSVPGWQDEEKPISQKINADYLAARTNMIRSEVEKAKAVFQKLRPTMKIAKMTTGDYNFTKLNRPAAVAHFEVPKSYLEKCLHAERPLTDDALAAMRAIFIGDGEDRAFDLRTLKTNGDEEMGLTFDKFIDGFKTRGSRYAWTNTTQGGRGENPSIDMLWNGQHGGFARFYDNRDVQLDLIRKLGALGYVGFAYDGGVRITGTGARGGGGMVHNAYVMWDEDKINSFRIGDTGVEDDDVGEFHKGLRANKVMR